MGFLYKTVFAKRLNKSNLFALAIIAGVISCGLATIVSSSSTFAEEVVDNYGLYTDSDGVRWEWEVVSDSENTEEPTKLNLMFYDKPENLTTVTVPSYDDMTTTTGITPISDTYYVRNANQESQDTRFVSPDPARRTTNQADVTVLDMTNTSKVQIMGVRPIINPETEVELIFGENMVIGDVFLEHLTATINICDYNHYRTCYSSSYYEDTDITENDIPNWDSFSYFDKQMGEKDVIFEGFDCNGTCYLHEVVSYNYSTSGGVFSGYRLKLTNLENVKYLGWFAFRDSILNESSRSIVIKDYQTAGEGAFQNTNVISVVFEGNTTFPAMFKDCSDLTNIDFGDVELIDYNTFENVPINNSLDLSETHVRVVQGRAFKNTGINSLNLGSVEKLGFEAFASNNISELDFPKTITDLSDGNVFLDNPIENVTVRFDTYQKDIPYRFVETLGCRDERGISAAYCINLNLKKLDIVAPYHADEPVSATHGEPTLVECGGGRYVFLCKKPTFSDEYTTESFNPNTFKNIISGGFFSAFGSIEEVIIGDGYEFIGDEGFYSYKHEWDPHNALKKISLPDTLLGIGRHVFERFISGNVECTDGVEYNTWSSVVCSAHPDVELPSSLVYIGERAFLLDNALFSTFDLPNLEYIGDSAFENTNLLNLNFRNKLKHIGKNAFYYYSDHSSFGGHHLFEGKRNVIFDSDLAVDTDVGAYYYPRPMQFGTITYTENAHHLPGNTRGKCGYGGYYNSIVGTSAESFLDATACTGLYIADGVHDVDELNIPIGNNRFGTDFETTSIDKFDLSNSSIKEIPDAFFQGVFIDELLLPAGLEEIGVASFDHATIYQELVLPEGLKRIGGSAFNAWGYSTGHPRPEDKEVVLGVKISMLPQSLEEIGVAAFYGDLNLTADVDLPNLNSFRASAFKNTGITGLHWHANTVLNIPEGSYENSLDGNYWLKEVVIDADLAGWDIYSMLGGFYNQNCAIWHPEYNGWCNPDFHHYDKVVINGDIIPESTALNANWGPYTSSYFYNFDTDELDLSGSSFSYLPRNAFINAKIGKLVLPDTISSIPSAAFYGAEIGGELKIPDSVTHLDGAFRSAKFNRIILPSGLQTADYNSVFWNAEVSDAIVVPEGVTNLPNNMFMNVKAKSVELPNTLETIGYNEFMFAKLEDELVLPESLKVIKDHAFYDADYLHSKWQGDPDGDWSKASDVIITKLPASLEKIGSNAFHGYRYELDVDLPNLKEIGGSAFMQANVKSVKLYDKIESIGSGAFLYNPNLRNIYLDCDFFGLHGSFYPIFSTVDPALPESYNPYWSGNQAQMTDGSSFDSIVFTDKSITFPTQTAFAYFDIKKLDIANAKWTKIPDYALFKTTVNEPVTVPDTVVEIAKGSFQESNITLTNTFSEGLRIIGEAAFYGASVSGDLVIPSTIESIGWSAFNAGNTDTNYGTVTIKPALDYDKTNNQAIFQMFWNAKMDKLIIESPMLPVLGTLQAEPVMPHEGQIWGLRENGTYGYITATPTLRADGEPEFHGMTMREVEIKNLPVITANAFEECANLETVSFANHTNLSEVGKFAFNNDTKLKKFVFGDGLVGKDVALKEYAFNNTAAETIGTHNMDFDLTAANFNAVEPHAFANMPKLVSVSIPSTFSVDASLANEELHTNGSTIPSYTFADDPELATVEVSYQLSTIKEDAFANDNKITKLILWGNTDIEENGTNLTIPEPTNIFAYSDAPGEQYANSETRADYDGKFYPLDEVLYLTSNKTYVILEQDEEGNNVDFEKDGLILYALRRDGVILESDDWQTYTKAYPRATAPNIVFEEGKGAAGNLGTDEELMWTVYDAPKPFNTISLANQNYGETNFEFIDMPSSTNPLVAIHYPDGYTAAIRTTTLASMTKEEEEEMLRELEVPNTGVFQTIASIAAPSVSIATIVVLGGIYIARRRNKTC